MIEKRLQTSKIHSAPNKNSCSIGVAANPLELVEVDDEVVEPVCADYNTDLYGNDINDFPTGIKNVESWSDCGKRTYKCYF